MNLSTGEFLRVYFEGSRIIGPVLQVELVCSYYTSIARAALRIRVGSEVVLCCWLWKRRCPS